MNAPPVDRRTGPCVRTDGAVTNETRRRIVAVLRRESGPVSQAELVRQVAADRPVETTDGDGPGSREALRIRLHHVHLPKLADRGLIEWDREDQTVAATDHPVYDADDAGSPGDRERPGDGAPAGTDDRSRRTNGVQTRRTIRHPTRRTVYDAILAADRPLTVDALGHRLVRAMTDGPDAAERSVRATAVKLHHVHLPKLHAEGLVEYDSNELTVRAPDRTDRTPGRAENATTT